MNGFIRPVYHALHRLNFESKICFEVIIAVLRTQHVALIAHMTIGITSAQRGKWDL